MKHIVFGTIWLMVILGISLKQQAKISSLESDIDNYKEMEKFYLRHIEFCDTLHEKCFKLTK